MMELEHQNAEEIREISSQIQAHLPPINNHLDAFKVFAALLKVAVKITVTNFKKRPDLIFKAIDVSKELMTVDALIHLKEMNKSEQTESLN